MYKTQPATIITTTPDMAEHMRKLGIPIKRLGPLVSTAAYNKLGRYRCEINGTTLNRCLCETPGSN